jgi:hypothetical protein
VGIFIVSAVVPVIELVINCPTYHSLLPPPSCLTLLSVLPHETVYTEYPSTTLGLDVMILHGNPHLTPRGGRIISDPRQRGVTVEDIAPCARIDLFEDLTIYTLSCRDKNAVLKYKGFGLLEARQGTKTKLSKGIVSMFIRRDESNSSLPGVGTMDMSTNITTNDVALMFSTRSEGGAPKR